MMNPSRVLRHSSVLRAGALSAALLAATGAAHAQDAPATFTLSNAPVTLQYPEEWKDWAISLAGYADAAAEDIRAITGAPIPAGTIRWEPAASGPGSGADGFAEVRGRQGGGATVVLRTNVPLMLQDFGAAYALGYGRWLGAYAMARVAMGAPGGMAPWWTEGAALYLTDRIFRDARTTTPVLYGIESNFVRAAQSRRPVDLAASPLSPTARGKALATFRLLEALYGEDAVAQAIGKMVQRPSAELASMVDAIGRDRTPDPDAMLRDWLEPTISMDISIDDVDIREEGRSVRVKVKRDTPIPVPVTVEVLLADGQSVTGTIPTGREDARIDLEIPGPPLAIRIDPRNLIPDVNRSNNREGFGSAENIRRFFTFDDRFEVGELRFSRQVELDDAQQRTESFTVRVRNLTDRQTGVGLLVSAAWRDRPARVQRAFFIPLGPGETRLVQETFAFPNRGNGQARVEARFWEATSVDHLTSRLISEEPGSTSNYVVVRDAPDAPRRARRGLYSAPPGITETSGVLAAADPEPTAVGAGPDAASAGLAEPAAPLPSGQFGIRILSPRRGDLPLGDVVLEAAVDGEHPVERVDFFVNDRRVGTATESPYRVPWSYPDDEQVFVIRTVAVGNERIASADLVLDRAAIAFGSTVNLVTLHVTVRDSQGRLVRGLGQEDFQVIEDGREQELVQVDFGEVPVSAAVSLDQSSSMIGSGIRAERAGATRLIESLVNEVNRAMVLGFNDKVFVYEPFTNDVATLTAALDSVDPDGPTALFDTLAESLRKVNRGRGKRALVVLSDGLDTNSQFKFEDVVEYVRQTEVLVYTIGIQLMQEGTALGDASGAVKRGIEQLRTMAEASGGTAYFPLSFEELEEIYALIADELNSQYAVSYYPNNQRFAGSWRELRVRVPAHPTYIVQVRPGYYGLARAGAR
jgi:VWFA-related protein